MPALKKARLSAPNTSIVSEPTPAASSPAHDSPASTPKALKLPSKISESRPLPTQSERQGSGLSDEEYQSYAASGILAASLFRSKQRWIHEGLFERYWVKPETGKHAKPPPPNNPELKWMKSKGPCRIRVEPHVFETDLYLEEKAKPPAPPKQYVPPAGQTAFGPPYRPPQPAQQFAPRQVSSSSVPLNQPGPLSRNPGIAPSAASGPAAAPHRQQPLTQPKVQPAPALPIDKKPSPDPVISMLAARASSDPELKGLMKEVATGNANPEQLKIFQRHIDELTAIIQKQKRDEEAASQQSARNIAAPDTTKCEQPATTQPSSYPKAQSQHVPQAPQSFPQHAQHPPRPIPPVPQYKKQQPWVPPVPVSLPVILGFTTPGASEDRFLFPQHSILETLSPQHTLASFIVVRKGRNAVDPIGLDPDTEYWQPVTMMVEVAYGREELLNCVRRWVKPAEEVRKHMEEIMGRCTRAPESYLAFRLPHRGASTAELDEAFSAFTSQTNGEMPQVADERSKKEKRASDKAAKRNSAAQLGVPETPAKDPSGQAETARIQTLDPGTPATMPVSGSQTGGKPADTAPDTSQDIVMADAPVEGGTGRPRRNTRKSVRISEGGAS